MTIHLTTEDALKYLDRAVAAKGADYRYEPLRVKEGATAKMCNYVRDGEASCIVGHALFYAGVPIELLAKMDDAEAWADPDADPDDPTPSEVGTAIGTLAGFITDEVTMSSDTLEMLIRAQRWQDTGDAWGDVVAYTKAWVEAEA